MSAKIGSFRHSFAERSKERLLSRKGYSDFGLNSTDDDASEDGIKCRCFRWISDGVINFWTNLQNIFIQFYDMGRKDPRKAVFAAKMGLSLALVSLVVFFKEPLSNVSQYSIWAILTVVVVFEFSVGTSLQPCDATKTSKIVLRFAYGSDFVMLLNQFLSRRCNA